MSALISKHDRHSAVLWVDKIYRAAVFGWPEPSLDGLSAADVEKLLRHANNALDLNQQILDDLKRAAASRRHANGGAT